jgi:NDP-sugar pyrophosphorylase family protein
LILVVMAAGAGSRYGGPKQLEALGPAGERLFDYAVFDAVRAGFSRAVFIVRPELEREFRAIAGALPLDPHVAVQRLADVPSGHWPVERDKPWGTAHAVLAARDVIDGAFAVINADDFYGLDAYRLAVEAGQLADEQGVTTVVAMRLSDTLSPHGPVTRAVCDLDGNRVIGLDEVHDIARTGADLIGTHHGRPRVLTGRELVSMNFWVCPRAMVPNLQHELEVFLDASGADPAAEFRLPEAIAAVVARGAGDIQALKAPGPWFGLTHPADREAVVAGLDRLAKEGSYPAPLWGR